MREIFVHHQNFLRSRPTIIKKKGKVENFGNERSIALDPMVKFYIKNKMISLNKIKSINKNYREELGCRERRNILQMTWMDAEEKYQQIIN